MGRIEIETEIMQENLCELRKIAGWTAEELGDKLGVTKQTISNIETGKVQMSRVQYIATRAVFECEIYLSEENTTLQKVMGVLFCGDNSIYKANKEEIRLALVSIASTAAAGIGHLQLFSVAVALLASFERLSNTNISLNSEPSMKWLTDLLSEKTEEDKNAFSCRRKP